MGCGPRFSEANKKENRWSPALCVSGKFQGKQRVFGAPFTILETREFSLSLRDCSQSESWSTWTCWSGANSEAKLRKSRKYPGGRRVISRKIERKREGVEKKGKENRRGARGKPRTAQRTLQKVGEAAGARGEAADGADEASRH